MANISGVLASAGLLGSVNTVGTIASYEAAGRASAGAITTTGTKVGDKVIAVLGRVISTGVWTALANSSFEATVTVANQIQQSTATNLSVNTYIFVVQSQ